MKRFASIVIKNAHYSKLVFFLSFLLDSPSFLLFLSYFCVKNSKLKFNSSTFFSERGISCVNFNVCALGMQSVAAFKFLSFSINTMGFIWFIKTGLGQRNLLISEENFTMQNCFKTCNSSLAHFCAFSIYRNMIEQNVFLLSKILHQQMHFGRLSSTFNLIDAGFYVKSKHEFFILKIGFFMRNFQCKFTVKWFR